MSGATRAASAATRSSTFLTSFCMALPLTRNLSNSIHLSSLSCRAMRSVSWRRSSWRSFSRVRRSTSDRSCCSSRTAEPSCWESLAISSSSTSRSLCASRLWCEMLDDSLSRTSSVFVRRSPDLMPLNSPTRSCGMKHVRLFTSMPRLATLAWISFSLELCQPWPGVNPRWSSDTCPVRLYHLEACLEVRSKARLMKNTAPGCSSCSAISMNAVVSP
mmetsp:Transcript_32227/g.102502  ORF Transcript_32227/g.102502 Transcript_32227/m.102502 type:complete len:217 (+) Transcript_32227:2505-3155(+)